MRFLIVTVSIAISPVAANAACLSYDMPQNVEGVFSLQSLPDGPNFERVVGDSVGLPVPILTLAKPGCVDAAGVGDLANEAVPSLHTVEVIIPTGKVDRRIVGRKVLATGEIFPSRAEQRNAPVLIDARTMKVAE